MACTHHLWHVHICKVTSGSSNGRKHQQRPVRFGQVTSANNKQYQLDDIGSGLMHRPFPLHITKFTSIMELSNQLLVMHIAQ